MTQKMSWNQINNFPHHSFHWQGIDGSSVLAHMLPEETYNSPALPRSVVKIENNYHDKGVSDHALMLFGIGDGGGGPGEEHLERLARIRNLAGLSPVRQEPAAAFLRQHWAQGCRALPHLGGRAVPGAPFRHADHRGQEQVVQPPHGTGPARAGMDALSWPAANIRPRAWKRSGTRCCSTSSTISCPVLPSSACMMKAWRATAACTKRSKTLICQAQDQLARAGRHQRG